MCKICGNSQRDCMCEFVEANYPELIGWIRDVVSTAVEKAVSEHRQEYKHERDRPW